MYSNFEYNTDTPFGYLVAPIKVFLVRSQICFEERADPQCLVPGEDLIEFTVNLPVFDNLGVPLDALINELSKASMTSFLGYQILYRVTDSPLYIFAGVFPFEDETVYVPVVDTSFPIFIKCRAAGKYTRDFQDFQAEEKQKTKTRRGNERVIGDVIDALLQWKHLYTFGQETAQGEVIKRTREDAARLLNIPKKTLDDYSAQVRLANEFGFDFQINCREKFGVLRKFNRMILAKRDFTKPC
eukprot:TRINITY_DN5664_c0_g1_i16.p1 TRINITY_DN5664_c0_g1~~TRINITY_DN5664_c0_g1_i16.p1  ORF type:complete len:242 (-),score=45.94 TRINITY_DN5664_c0_g1_i16:129-854(-)